MHLPDQMPPSRTGLHGLSSRTVTLVAIVACTLLCGVWAVATPLMDAPDEATHALRAAAVWYGTLHGADRLVEEPPAADGSVTKGTLTEVRVPQAYVDLQTVPECYQLKRSVPADCAPGVETDQTMVSAATYTGTYQPTYYALVGWPSRLFGPYRALYAMRLVSAVLSGVLLGLGIGAAHRCARRPFAVVGAALAATPMVFFIAGTINPSALEITAAFATWLGLLALVRHAGRPPTALVLQVAVTASLFAASRPLSPVLLLLMGAIFGLAALDRPRVVELARDRRIQIALGLTGLVVAASAAWVLSTHAYDAFTGISIPGLTAAEAARRHLDMFPFRARQMIGYFAMVDAPLPDPLIWLWYVAVAVLGGLALVVGTWRRRAAVAASVAVCLVIPLASEVSKAHEYGFIWQGRYALPVAVAVPILAAWVVAEADRPGRSVLRPTAVAVAVAVAAVQVVAHLTLMTRVSVGLPAPMLRYLTDARWSPPVAAGLLLALTLAAAVGYAAVLALAGTDDPGETPPTSTADAGDSAEHLDGPGPFDLDAPARDRAPVGDGPTPVPGTR